MREYRTRHNYGSQHRKKYISFFVKKKHWKEKKWVLNKKKKKCVSGRKSFWVTRIGNV